MPEGDTLHRIADAMAPRLEGRAVLGVEAPRSEAKPDALVGARVTRVRAQGKYLVIEFDCGIAVVSHLRMDGVWHLYAPGQPFRRARSRLRLLVAVEGTVAACFDAPVVRFLHSRDLARFLGPSRLGPDILGEGFDLDDAVRRLRARPDVPLGIALLDQRRIAGIGNVYKSEVCFHARLSPLTPVSTFDPSVLAKLCALTREVMMANVAKARPDADLRRHHAPHYLYQRDTTLGARRTTKSGCEVGKAPIYVYGRASRPCFACGTAIVRTRQGEQLRSTYYCPTCQPA